MTTAVYLRVSTAEQNEAGQRAEIERWLSGNGITDAVWYLDKQTGDNLDRPEFKKLQRDIFNGQVKTVCVWKLDRLARSLRDGINVLCDWCDRGLRVVSVTQQVDFSGALGKMLAAVLLGIAEMEQQTRRERQRAGIAIAKQRGAYKGRKRGSTTIDRSRVQELAAKGLEVREIMTALGCSKASVYRALAATAA